MLLTSKRLGVVHAFSTREGGVSQGAFESLNLGRSVGDVPEHVAENGRRFAAKLGITPGQIICANQVHGETILEVHGASPGDLIPPAIGDADALVTRAKGVAIGIRTADCVPVLLYAPDVGAVGAAHAGWRGAVAAIAGKTVKRMAELYAASPQRMLAVVGPHIRACCYEVGEDVAKQFEARFGLAVTVREGQGGTKLDLAEANRRALLEAGVLAENIEVLDACTSCDAIRFFSHRRDQGRSGRHLSVISIG